MQWPFLPNNEKALRLPKALHTGTVRRRWAARTFTAVVILLAVSALPTSRAYCQQQPPEKDGTPHEVPVSPEEKKALEEAAQQQGNQGGLDEIVLKDDTRIRGHVVDPGGPVIRVEQKLGAISILKSQIKEWHLHSDPGSMNLDEDVVHLSSGEQMKGRAEISEDGKELKITMTRDGQEHTVKLPYAEVVKIEWAKERRERLREQLEQFEDPLVGRIVEILGDLSSKDETVWRPARDKLVALGVFATEHLKERLEKLDEPAATRVREVLRINDLRGHISSEAAESFKRLEQTDIYEKLVSGEKEEKLKALRKLVMLEDDAAPLLMYIARTSTEDTDVRSFCLHGLARDDRNMEILKLMTEAQEKDGWLRLACALYLSDNGIHIGAPHFISALRMRDPGMRKVAAEKLRTASGKNFGFDPEGTEAEREAAIKKWDLWWEEHSAEILRQSAKSLSPEPIDSDDRGFSTIYFKRGHAAWDKGNLEEAYASLRKAVELDPSNLTARLSLAMVLYTALDRKEDARRELSLILKRYADEASPLVRKLTFYHLALLELSGGRWEGALHNLHASIALDGKFTDGYIALGKTYYIQAVNDEMISRETLLSIPESKRKELEELRREIIGRSVRSLEIGLGLLDENIRDYTGLDFRKRRREEERWLEERLGAKAEGVTQTQWEASLKEVLLRKKARVYLMLADSYALQLEWKKAARCLRDAARLVPDEPEYLCKLGSALAAAGNREEAREAFRRCLKADPGNKTAIQGLEDLK